MAYASERDFVNERSPSRTILQRNPSYSANFQTECAKSCVISDLTDLIRDFENNCTCHLNGSSCQLGRDKHQLFGLIGHVLQENLAHHDTYDGSQIQRVLARQQSFDFMMNSKRDRPSLTDMSSSNSSESGISSLSQNESIGMDSIDEESNFVIKRGHLLIINNIWFEGMFGARNGSKAESDKMKALFESFGFDVDVECNCSTDKIRNLLRRKANNYQMKEYDCFALLVMSHGAEDCILGSDSEEISYEEVMSLLKADQFPAMAGKPKLIFVQACRGIISDYGCVIGRGGSDISMDCGTNNPSPPPNVRIPTDSDILIVYATTRGRAAHRPVLYHQGFDPVAESWFLEGLHQVLLAHAANEDLLSMLTRVNSHVAMLGDGKTGMQIPAQFSTLTRKVYLRKKIS